MRARQLFLLPVCANRMLTQQRWSFEALRPISVGVRALLRASFVQCACIHDWIGTRSIRHARASVMACVRVKRRHAHCCVQPLCSARASMVDPHTFAYTRVCPPLRVRRCSRAVEQQSSRAAEQQSSRAAEQQSSSAAAQWSSRAATSRTPEWQSGRALQPYGLSAGLIRNRVSLTARLQVGLWHASPP
jgi:hypothetical protein